MVSAKVMQLSEVLEGYGHGWCEVWYLGDDEDPEEKLMFECVWIHGYIMQADGDISTAEYVKKWYNQPGGLRIWDQMPTFDESESEPWDDPAKRI